MSVTRRQAIRLGGGFVAAACLLPSSIGRARDVMEIAMEGRPDGSLVWFDPIGLHVQPGQTIRWVNRDPGNSHTATAYHPANFEKSRRIPAAAQPWDSEYLLPEQSFSVTLSVPGVYDYYCIPHELAGMVGRIVVGQPPPRDWRESAEASEGVPDAALAAFPAVRDIISQGAVRRA